MVLGGFSCAWMSERHERRGGVVSSWAIWLLVNVCSLRFGRKRLSHTSLYKIQEVLMLFTGQPEQHSMLEPLVY